jgi:hypothetical protein
VRRGAGGQRQTQERDAGDLRREALISGRRLRRLDVDGVVSAARAAGRRFVGRANSLPCDAARPGALRGFQPLVLVVGAGAVVEDPLHLLQVRCRRVQPGLEVFGLDWHDASVVSSG